MPLFSIGDLSVTETVDVAGDILTAQFKVFFKIIVCLFIPVHALFLSLIFYWSPQMTLSGALDYFIGLFSDPERAMMSYDLRGQSGVLILQAIYFLLNLLVITPFTTGALTRAAVIIYQERTITARAAMIWALKNLIKLSLTSLYAWLVIIGLSIFAALIFALPLLAFFFVRENLPPVLMIFAMLGGVLGLGALATVSFIAMIKLALIFPLIAAENCAYGRALKRSSRLTRRRISRGIWLFFMISTIGLFCSTAINGIPNAGALGILGATAQGFGIAISTVIITIYYFNCCSLHENLDIFLLLRNLPTDNSTIVLSSESTS